MIGLARQAVCILVMRPSLSVVRRAKGQVQVFLGHIDTNILKRGRGIHFYLHSQNPKYPS